MEEYGKQEQEEKTNDDGLDQKPAVATADKTPDSKKARLGLIQAEERLTGSVLWSVYSEYLRFAGGLVWAPIIVIFLTLTQGASGEAQYHYRLSATILADFIFSGKQSLPWILDRRKYRWI